MMTIKDTEAAICGVAGEHIRSVATDMIQRLLLSAQKQHSRMQRLSSIVRQIAKLMNDKLTALRRQLTTKLQRHVVLRIWKELVGDCC